jgi:hypothetical protein
MDLFSFNYNGVAWLFRKFSFLWSLEEFSVPLIAAAGGTSFVLKQKDQKI